MPNYTLTYSEGSKGFPSFYSYYPDYMVGMNNYFYTFRRGQLYRHNTNEIHNIYYNVIYNSEIKTVINESPLENKLFKTIKLESTDAWTANIVTDVESQQGDVDYLNFELKEGDWFAYVRNSGVSTTNTTLSEDTIHSRTVGGLGVPTNITGLLLTFPAESETSIISNNDLLYQIVGGTPVYFGTVNTTETTATGFDVYYIGSAPTVGNQIIYVKNTAAESMGVLGHYAEITLTLPVSVTTASELFAIECETMKSYP